jgi:glycosyltransferase involved in cell wall biosynthesis
MKLVIQIPAYNEAAALPATLAALPRALPGFDSVEWLVIDDGSADDTAAVARAAGARHVVRLPRHLGLARAFAAGLEAALAAGADFVVNTDADNQYRADDIPALLAPLLAGEADLAIGARPIEAIAEFSPAKRRLQRLGSALVRRLSGLDVADATSGFRAFTRSAAARTQVFDDFTYTLETILQAGQNGLAVVSVPVRVNPAVRPSRLMRGTGHYLWRSALTLVRVHALYRPLVFFSGLGLGVFGAGFLLGCRFLWHYALGRGQGMVQSVVLASLLMGSGLALAVVALIADLISINRRLLERVHHRLDRLEGRPPAPPR